MKKGFVSVITVFTIVATIFSGCGSNNKSTSDSKGEKKGEETSSDSEKVVLTGLADLVPHNE